MVVVVVVEGRRMIRDGLVFFSFFFEMYWFLFLVWLVMFISWHGVWGYGMRCLERL